MTASLSRTPAREDASHCPPFAARPLTLRAWPSHRGVNDNQIADVPQPEAACERLAEAPRRKPSSSLATAICGLAGALSLVIAILCLMAR